MFLIMRNAVSLGPVAKPSAFPTLISRIVEGA